MEYHWTLINNSTSNSSGVREHNNGSNHAWETWDLATSAAISREDWSYPLHNSFNYNYTPSRQLEASAFHTLMLQDQEKNDNTSCSSPYVGNLDPHLTCLKLGKRHYFEDVTTPLLAVAGPSTKKGKTYYAPPVTVDDSALTVVPRCQVEGCEAVLVSAKDYHRRHKVCEMHAKAPKVVLLGIEQRFCQQCSRFHAVAEFDESKRSCRRRLAGHNERRRKSSQEHQSLANKHSQDMKMMDACRQPEFLNSSECALSLLSSTNYSPWNRADLPSRCSAALRELIAENRASILACRQIQNYKLNGNPQQNGGGHVTLDLMQVPSSAFGFLSVNDHKSSSKETNEEDCSELWKLPLGYSSHSL